MVRMMILAASIAAMTGSMALAKPALRDVPELDNRLFAVGLAEEIRRNCPQISGRMLKAFGYLQDLANDALELGYTLSLIHI